jgi:hypothetical protein
MAPEATNVARASTIAFIMVVIADTTIWNYCITTVINKYIFSQMMY